MAANTIAAAYSRERIAQAIELMTMPHTTRDQIARLLAQPIGYHGETFDRSLALARLLTDLDRSEAI